MGLLGTAGSSRKRRKARKKAKQITRKKQRRLDTIRRLSLIEQSFRRGALADTVFDRGLEDSALGSRLLEQNRLRDSEEKQAINIAGDTLDLERLNQKIQEIQAKAEVFDQALGIVGGLAGVNLGGTPVDPLPTVGTGIGITGQEAISPALKVGGAGPEGVFRGTETEGALLLSGGRATIRGAPGIAATSAAGAGFQTGRTRAEPREGSFRMGTILGF